MLELLTALDEQILRARKLSLLGVNLGELLRPLEEEAIQMICTTIVGERIERGIRGKDHPKSEVYMELVREIDDWLARKREVDFVMVNFDGSTVHIESAEDFLSALIQLHSDMATDTKVATT